MMPVSGRIADAASTGLAPVGGLALLVARNIRHGDVQECLTDLFCQRGVPARLRSDNGP
jgi:hypothetical protein